MTVPEKWDRETDVLIVGSGYVGLSAAIEAHDLGIPVTILEKMRHHGGNSILAMGNYNCVNPERQKALGIEDSVELFYEQTLAGGDYRAEPDKVRYLAEHALEGWKWLEGMGIGCARLSQGYGGLWPRHHTPSYKGKSKLGVIVACLYDQVKARGIPLLLKHKVTNIIREGYLEGRVIGVEVETGGKKLYFKARRALLLAAGGFAADVKMRMRHDPRFDDRFTTTNHAGATGEILNMAADVGASLKGMEYIQCIGSEGRDLRNMPRPAPVRQHSPALRLGGLRTDTVVYINFKGERITAADTRRDYITEAVMKTPEKMCFMIIDSKALETTDRTSGQVSLEEAKRMAEDNPKDIFMADTLQELASKTGMDPDTLKQSIDKYNSYVDAKHDPDFNQSPRNLTNRIDSPPFFAVSGSPTVHHTCGGLEFETTTCRVLDRWGEIIPGLYAAGEVTGGVHGTNRLGGNATAECIIFGRLAGKSASAEAPWE